MPVKGMHVLSYRTQCSDHPARYSTPKTTPNHSVYHADYEYCAIHHAKRETMRKPHAGCMSIQRVEGASFKKPENWGNQKIAPRKISPALFPCAMYSHERERRYWGAREDGRGSCDWKEQR